ncbi:MAG TPA: hypothetical protein VFS44_05615 [Gemmatimonadaceae bacterium]|nr:hypothetical protein [Gemmatimonadaceae bacterium]
MTTRTLTAALVAGALSVAAGSLSAQSAFTRAKRAAGNAAAATNRHIRAEQDVPDGQMAATAAPSGGAAHAPRASATPARSGAPAGAKAGASAAKSSAGAGPTAAPTTPAGGKTAARADTVVRFPGGRNPAREGAATNELTLSRESFTYSADGRRDPFLSLLDNGDLRPMLSDLRLVTVVYDPSGRSVAVLRDLTTNEQYRVRPGQTLGRMRVAQIRPKSITFTLEEYGYSRQEVLALNDSTRARSQ